MPRNTGTGGKRNRGLPIVRPPVPAGYVRVDQLAQVIRVTDEQIRTWIRRGRLSAESRRWRGKPYYLIPYAEVDRILADLGVTAEQVFGPFDRAPELVGAGERGSGSALALGALGGGAIAPGLHDHTHLLMIGGTVAAFLIVLGVLWVVAGRIDRP